MHTQDLLQGRTALITGASKGGGIGAAIAEIYAINGANLILTARSESGLKEVHTYRVPLIVSCHNPKE